ncbi:glycoside hydrolase family 35 protein [Amorphotheca resinae ATCC 22711]|uniref:Beta-galactosidase n=1 Tax=Amorphotheca resinae ATCC 22711 TaxID=857342 RepID=A0A2T3AZ44_AMORE|nr:glycoside hydrolase family 35 protein [Amorphotheca resinae ATCC 22711]PSS15320.1 glycoside hydrolase family 35 protein [Amorphotheca resinae ATCC 22711]
MHCSFLFTAFVVFLSTFGSVTCSSSFTWNRQSFLLNGEPYQIIGGQMDPQRIPYQYWPDRLYKARAMGLNTIFSYVFWDQIQPTPDTWDLTGRNNVAEYFRLAQEVGLNVVLRAGPFVCGEHEWGGFPAWLSEVPGMVVRSNNAPFMNASKAYIERLATELQPLLITHGGPILMAQIENEYGSYGADHTYMAALRDMFNDAFGLPLYTNDGGGESYLIGGQIHGALAETDGSPQVGFAARDQYVTDPISLGPQLDGEYYITWLDLWASNSSYQTDVGSASSIKAVQEDLSWILTNNSSFNIYMFHGGTNWGFQNGADWSDSLTPVTTSYDYGAPLDESGRITDVYSALRETISSYVAAGSIPPVPKQIPPIQIDSIEVSPTLALFDFLPQPISAVTPTNMEALNQSHGFILYRHTVQSAISGTLETGDAPRDRLLIYLNGKRAGVIDSIYQYPQTVTLALQPNDVLDILVENMGRVNYGPRIPDQRKGIVGNVTVGGSTLMEWEMFPLSMEEPPTPQARLDVKDPVSSGPVFYSGSFDVDTLGDTFLELPGWTKGVVWVNGINLGRYWTVGPQQTLYLPGCYLKNRNNDITVLALEPNANQGAIRGIQTRNWGNNPDPDAP